MSRKGFTTALLVATVFSLAQLFTGHRSAETVAEHQPAKLAALEGHFDSRPLQQEIGNIISTKKPDEHG